MQKNSEAREIYYAIVKLILPLIVLNERQSWTRVGRKIANSKRDQRTFEQIDVSPTQSAEKSREAEAAEPLGGTLSLPDDRKIAASGTG